MISEIIDYGNILSALIAFVGIFIGWLLSNKTEKMRLKREDSSRFNNLKRELYLRFITETDKASLLLQDKTTDIDPEVLRKLSLLHEEMLLICPPNVLLVVLKYFDALYSLTGGGWHLWSASGGSAGRGPAEKSELNKIKYQFINEVRKDFGVHEMIEEDFYNSITKTNLPLNKNPRILDKK